MKNYLKELQHNIILSINRLKTLHHNLLQVDVDKEPESPVPRNLYQALLDWTVGVLEDGFMLAIPYSYFIGGNILSLSIALGLGFEAFKRTVKVIKG